VKRSTEEFECKTARKKEGGSPYQRGGKKHSQLAKTVNRVGEKNGERVRMVEGVIALTVKPAVKGGRCNVPGGKDSYKVGGKNRLDLGAEACGSVNPTEGTRNSAAQHRWCRRWSIRKPRQKLPKGGGTKKKSFQKRVDRGKRWGAAGDLRSVGVTGKSPNTEGKKKSIQLEG